MPDGALMDVFTETGCASDLWHKTKTNTETNKLNWNPTMVTKLNLKKEKETKIENTKQWWIWQQTQHENERKIWKNGRSIILIWFSPLCVREFSRQTRTQWQAGESLSLTGKWKHILKARSQVALNVDLTIQRRLKVKKCLLKSPNAGVWWPTGPTNAPKPAHQYTHTQGYGRGQEELDQSC